MDPERVLDVDERRGASFRREGDAHDIEAELVRGSGVFVEIEACRSHNAVAFPCIDGFQGVAVFLARARANLDEDEDPMVVRYQVDLSLRSSPVALDDAQAATFE